MPTFSRALRIALAFDAAARRAHAAYIFTGGIAASAYGRARATDDIDTWVALPEDRNTSFITALQQDGLYVAEGAIEEARKTEGRFTVFEPELELHLDCKIARSPREIEEVARGITFRVSGGRVCLVCPEDLIIWKAHLARPLDLKDIEDVLSVQRRPVDWDRLDSLMKDVPPKPRARALIDRFRRE